MRSPVLLLLGMLLLTSAGSALAEPARSSSGPDGGVSAVLPLSRQFDFKSAINGRTYRVQVAIPFVPAPQNGYAVLYMLDGDQVVKSIAEAAMIRNATDLGDRLRALPSVAGYDARVRVFDGETHVSVGWATVGPFLDFALASEKPGSDRSSSGSDDSTTRSR